MRTKFGMLSNNNIDVWTRQPHKELMGIQNLEGVANCLIVWDNLIFVEVAPCYDQKEIAEEIRLLLTADVPDVFKEGSKTN